MTRALRKHGRGAPGEDERPAAGHGLQRAVRGERHGVPVQVVHVILQSAVPVPRRHRKRLPPRPLTAQPDPQHRQPTCWTPLQTHCLSPELWLRVKLQNTVERL